MPHLSSNCFLKASLACVAMVLSARGNGAGMADISDLSLGELMDLEVSTPGKAPETIRETPASVYVFSRDDIEVQGYRNLTEILENVPGFYNIDNYNGVSGNFGVRGLWNGRAQNSSVAILVNGVPQARMDLRANPMEILNVPVTAIDRIEVTRGPNTVIYGNGASFGAINIITDESYYDDQIRVSRGSYGTEQVSARWSMFSADGHLILNTGWSRTDGLDYKFSDLMGPDNLALLSGYGVSELDSGLADRMEQEGRYIQLVGEWQDLYFDFSYNKSTVESFASVPPVADGSVRVAQVYRMTAGLLHEFSSTLSLDTRVNYSDYSLAQKFDAFTPGFIADNSLVYDGWEVESLLNYSPSSTLRLITGVNWQHMQNMHELTNVPALGLNNEVVNVDHRDAQSFFTQFSYQTSDKLRVVGGFRIEQSSAFDRFGYATIGDAVPSFGGRVNKREIFTPRVSLIYQVSEQHLLKFMAGDAVKLAATTNATRPPVRTRAYELNYIYSQEDFMLSASVFRNAVTGLQIEELAIPPEGGIMTGTFVGGKVETLGLEVLLRRDFDEIWEGEIGVTWQDSNDLAHPDQVLSYSPELVVHGKLVYRKGDFSGTLVGRYVGNMYPFYEVSESNIVGLYIGDQTSAYFVADANVRWDELWDHFYVSIRVSNLLNEEVRYPNNPVNSTILDRGTLGGRRSAYLTVGMEF